MEYDKLVGEKADIQRHSIMVRGEGWTCVCEKAQECANVWVWVWVWVLVWVWVGVLACVSVHVRVHVCVCVRAQLATVALTHTGIPHTCQDSFLSVKRVDYLNT